MNNKPSNHFHESKRIINEVECTITLRNPHPKNPASHWLPHKISINHNGYEWGAYSDRDSFSRKYKDPERMADAVAERLISRGIAHLTRPHKIAETKDFFAKWFTQSGNIYIY